jgi:hypothetical protein
MHPGILFIIIWPSVPRMSWNLLDASIIDPTALLNPKVGVNLFNKSLPPETGLIELYVNVIAIMTISLKSYFYTYISKYDGIFQVIIMNHQNMALERQKCPLNDIYLKDFMNI